ncbi:hypothetical protein MCEGE14_02722 [Burkholderiaceae bacterium]
MSERRIVLPARQAHIEYLRTRAAYERQALSFHTAQLGRGLSPKRWLAGLMRSNHVADSGDQVGLSRILGKGFSLAAQYPYLTAAISSLLVGKRWRWVKLAGIGIGILRAYVGSNTPKP